MCKDRGLSTNVDILKDAISEPTSNMIPNMLVFVIVMSMLMRWFILYIVCSIY